MSELSELTAEVLDNPTQRALKIIELAEELGWTTGKISLCVRLSRPGDPLALPFYATFVCNGRTAKTHKPSWSFFNAAAKNLQQLSEDDIPIYLANPEAIWPQPPEETEEEGE